MRGRVNNKPAKSKCLVKKLHNEVFIERYRESSIYFNYSMSNAHRRIVQPFIVDTSQDWQP